MNSTRQNKYDWFCDTIVRLQVQKGQKRNLHVEAL